MSESRIPFPHFYNNNYYPVNMEGEIIYNDPKPSEAACREAAYADHAVTGISGRQLNQYLAYRSFAVSQPIYRSPR